MLKKFVAGILSLVFILIAVPFFFIFGFYNIFFDKDFYTGQFIDSAYEFLLEKVPGFIELKQFPNISEKDFSQLIAGVISKEDLVTTVEDIASQLRDIEIAQDGKFEVNIPINWLKNKGPLISEKIAALLLKDLPKCEGAVSEDFDSEGPIECLPKELSQEDLKLEVESALNSGFFADTPGVLHFTATSPKNFEGKFGDLSVKVMRWFFLGGGALLLVILLLIWLAIFKPFILVLKWWIKTLFFSALFLTIPLAAVSFLTKEARMVFGIIDVILGDVARIMLIYSVIAVVVFLGLWIVVNFFVRKKEKKLKL